MRCPFCKHPDTKVVDSRLQAEGEQVRRRRECLSCKERFTTFETADLHLPRIVKRDGSREIFNENKLASGLTRALEKRPVASSDIDDSLHRIGHRAMAYKQGDVPSRVLGDWVMAELRELDKVAYVRFASVYREFQDVSEFRDEIDRLESGPSAEQRKRQTDIFESEEPAD